MQRQPAALAVASLAFRSDAAVTLILTLVILNYFILFVTWYYLFKSATHDVRENILILMQDAMMGRLAAFVAHHDDLAGVVGALVRGSVG